jgi:conjugal transfer pilus assembly protein TraD
MLVTQAIRRGEAVVIIDPKGDHDLRENAQRACELMGKLKDFAVLHPAYPSRCIRMDPLKNYNRLTELSSRIAALIPSETGSDPFKSFCQMALNNIVQGMFEVGEVMQLRSIRSYLEGGVDDLTIRAIEKYCDRYVDGWQTMASKFIGQVKRDKPDQYAKRLIDFYWQVVKGIRSSSDIEGLLHHAKHDREHLTKMISSLLPVMGMLTSGELGRLLSPDDSDMDDPRRILDLKTIIRNKMVLYVGLDSLSDPMVASAIGSMFLSDLSAVAGDRYNYVDKSMLEPVNIFVDEASEVINDPFIQILNKGRGAKFIVTAATQTLSDYIRRCGSEDAAYQVLGNFNNWICLRVVDTKTQKYFAEALPKTKVKYIMRTQGSSSATLLEFKGNSGERLMEEEAEMFPGAMLGKLPDLEFVASFGGGKLWKGRLPRLESH